MTQRERESEIYQECKGNIQNAYILQRVCIEEALGLNHPLGSSSQI